MSEENGTNEESKRPRKLLRDIEGSKVKFTSVGGTQGEMVFDTDLLPAEIKEALIPFGLNHKLGDSASGKEGTDAEEAIMKVWEGLMAGDWTVRAPATPKVSVKSMVDKIANLDPEAQAKARELLASLGVTI
jgi:hypothetical protein